MGGPVPSATEVERPDELAVPAARAEAELKRPRAAASPDAPSAQAQPEQPVQRPEPAPDAAAVRAVVRNHPAEAAEAPESEPSARTGERPEAAPQVAGPA